MIILSGFLMVSILDLDKEIMICVPQWNSLCRNHATSGGVLATPLWRKRRLIGIGPGLDRVP